MSQHSAETLTAHEFVAHLYAPTSSPRAVELYTYLRGLWSRCQVELGMTSPIPALGVPPDPPAHSEPDETAVFTPIAAARREGDGVHQVLLRRVHDVLCLSVSLAPRHGSDLTWARLRSDWASISEPLPDGLLGTAELYLALFPASGLERTEAGADLSAACRALLPAPAAADFDGRGVSTAGGFIAWDADTGPDDRLTRRIVALAPADHAAELSSWAWSRGGPAEGMVITPLARYLMQAAKLRYHLRVWAAGAPVRAARRDTESALATVTALLDESSLLAARPVPFNSAAHSGALLDSNQTALDRAVALLRAEIVHLAGTATALRQMRRSVEASAANMAALADQIPASARDRADADHHHLYADDDALATWFARQLDDDLFSVETTVDRARAAIGDIVPTSVPPTPPAPPEHPKWTYSPTVPPIPASEAWPVSTDIDLTAPDRAALLDTVASLFPTENHAGHLLHQVGLPRERRVGLESVAPIVGWSQIFAEFDNGVIFNPYRRLLAAALALYPYNPTLRNLARANGLKIALEESQKASTTPDYDPVRNVRRLT
ncbi:hypothetical protein FF36_04873 [Frankia torreyi]|uniref:Uncharacterized protein n=1 Tax=Frankia torreyi TaxID=1856 RepID=A0A0D8B9Q3_9ACTN|nr:MULTISPECIES: CATRA conflict system CASPASE/TPR repeat-associated protein [Frankia]KJE20825.1 hypothetical protein FF36_04873 [Frankia torreyi]